MPFEFSCQPTAVITKRGRMNPVVLGPFEVSLQVTQHHSLDRVGVNSQANNVCKAPDGIFFLLLRGMIISKKQMLRK